MTGSKLWHRLPVALLVAACGVTVVIAVSGAGQPVRGLDFAQSGHWVANPGLDVVFHVNGAAKNVDTRAPMAIDPGSRVYQGDTSAYVVGQARIRQFGKSTLRVERTITPPTGERPVGIEAPGGPYLVYREAGTVVRLGEQPATIRAGRGLGNPVVTPDGTLWVHRSASGVLCMLPRGSDQVSCPAVTPQGHSGALTVVGDRPAFVDTTQDTVRAVAGDGLGTPVDLGVDVPAVAKVAAADSGGRIPILDPATSRLHLVDGAGVSGTGPAAAPVTVQVPEGEYANPEPSGDSVVLLDVAGNTVRTYGSDGRPRGVTPVPPETGEPRLSRGDDARVYVDGDKGGHVMVVDEGGAVSQVPLVGEERPRGEGEPQAPPPERAPDAPPPPSPPAGRDRRVLAEPPPQPAPGQSQGQPQRLPLPGPRPDPSPASVPAPPPPEPPPPPPVPASPPGIAGGVTATPQPDGTVRVTWGAAAPNGAPVTAYHVSWQPATGAGGLTVPGTARSAVLSGLERGTGHTVTVVAENRAGRGPAASTQVMTPGPVVTVTRGDTESFNETCEAPDCAKMLITMTGFDQETEYRVTPYSTGTYENEGGTYTTDENGNYDFQAFHFGQVGEQVWVVVEGPNGERYESNRYTWPAS
ncbi:fibronectin type III domain-containing protein [Prauserella oleivorans]|uniref:Fibronectin type III domain-containing protein n=1 Tax=Prauserella oleivorans TaxID=1478153 RepID=A0ABW5W744_9PSEU